MSWIKSRWNGLLASMVREKASPEFIARGWAIGMFYGCTIPFGFQLILSIPTALVMRGSKIGAVAGTFITNHFTIFLIYPVQCWLGNRLMGGDLSYSHITAAMKEVVQEQSWQSVLQLGGELMEAFFLGGFLLAAICVPLTYWGVLRYVRRSRKRRMARVRARAERPGARRGTDEKR
ncbi:MAG: DUF2062 domain-containing protein [Kiritimatiellia bacterium]